MLILTNNLKYYTVIYLIKTYLYHKFKLNSLNSRLKISQIPELKYVIVTIPEDIGIMANLGRPGASEAPDAFLKYFLNMQNNDYFDFSTVLVLGEIIVADLMESARKTVDLSELRSLTSNLDLRIYPVLAEIFKSGLIPIIIGGGNNNSYAIIKALNMATSYKIDCVNMDPHADFRILEGRHSGNPFSYAFSEGLLDKYLVFGLQENYNSSEMLSRFMQSNCKAITYEDMFLHHKINFTQGLNMVIEYFQNYSQNLGLELDMDSIINMPTSAQSPFGFEINQAATYLYFIASKLKTSYLHLSEASPSLHSYDGSRIIGKSLAYLVLAYLKGSECLNKN